MAYHAAMSSMNDWCTALIWITAACAQDNAQQLDASVCEGDQFVGDSVTLAALADCTRVTGNLVFTGNELVHAEHAKLSLVDGSLSVWGNPSLRDIELPELTRVGGYLLVEANELLAAITIPKLTNVNDRDVTHHADVSISGNPQLPTCQAHALRDQLLAADFTGDVAISGNMGSCPP